ncbi:hypothetical protein Rhe02_00840 [Rhizocola hellebori]|uniref:Diiron oxygenase n=1 Tax=Rhizocola hellebori TaxID=1392758 RepID=A0A8J3Q242_9ACTN|nr:hypothetical protein Rhe02_00840 [Rhizocola hellebori]
MLDTWYEAAGVRNQIRRMLTEDRELGLVPFPEHLTPFLDHRHVKELGPQARQVLLTRQLYQYMLFTVNLETRVVNRGMLLVSEDREAGRGIRQDALKIYIDEGYHALYSMDVLHQIEESSGVTALPYHFAPRLRRLDEVAGHFLAQQRELAHVLQVAAFETMVTSLLLEIPRDRGVYHLVREVVGDHARDEAQHHAFFVRYFRELWTHLPTSIRPAVARAMPHFIDACVRPDLAPIRESLAAVGLSAMDVEEVIADSYPEAVLRDTVRTAGRHTLKLCESVGAFDLPGARDELHRLGLADG